MSSPRTGDGNGQMSEPSNPKFTISGVGKATLAAALFLCLAASCIRAPVRDKRIVYAEQKMRQRAARAVEGRAVWVTRWDYKTPEDIKRIIKNCASLHCNIVFFQVRGNATVFYRSKLEPWAWELTSTGPATTGRDPGFDPLALAVEEAHRHGLELHAYMNVFPGWRGQKYPPPEAGQLWTRHPEWFMVDRRGRKMIPRDHEVDPRVKTFYSFLNPANPDVQDHVVAVFREVAEHYDVDGIHLDYVRYPGEIGDFSYDPVSLRRFREETGKTPDEAPELWRRWRGDQVSRVVARIYDECKKVSPDLLISAAVGPDPIRARDVMMQRAFDWLAAGKLDAAVPMIYTTERAVVARSVSEYVSNARGRLVFAGLMVGSDAKSLVEQISAARMSGAHGIALFSYSLLFPHHKPNKTARALRAVPFRQRARVPLPPTEPGFEPEEKERLPTPPPH